MAGQEIKSDLSGWDQSLGLDLLPPCAHLGLRSLPPTAVQELGSRNPCLTKLALNQASHSCRLTHVSKRRFYSGFDETEIGMGY